MKQFLPDFFITPREVAHHTMIEAFDEKVYAVVYWFEKMKDGQCTASNQTIAEVANPYDPQPRSVQNSLNRLEEYCFIKRFYKDKARRHRTSIKTLVSFARVRNTDDTITQNEPGMIPERIPDDSQSEPGMTRYSNKNKEKNIEERGAGPEKSIHYLSAIPYEDMKMFVSRVVATEEEIQNKAEDLLLWCETNGRKKSNYRAFLLNALKRDFKRRDSKEGKYVNL